MLRDIKLRYKQTDLGVVWVVFQPVITAALFTVVFGKCLHIATDQMPYLIFAYAGLIPWLVFSQSIQRGSLSLINEATLIQKVYFPRIFLPISGTFGVGIDFVITLLIFFILMPFYRIVPHLNLFFLPLCSILTFLFASSVNIFLSCLSAHYRDFKHIIPFFLQFWMYASPVAYPTTIIPDQWQWAFCLNPLTGLIDIFRWSLIGVGPFPVFSFLISLFTTIIFLITSLILFRKLEKTIIDVI
jgi:lipopolysaccharide transport system permease protein